MEDPDHEESEDEDEDGEDVVGMMESPVVTGELGRGLHSKNEPKQYGEWEKHWDFILFFFTDSLSLCDHVGTFCSPINCPRLLALIS